MDILPFKSRTLHSAIIAELKSQNENFSAEIEISKSGNENLKRDLELKISELLTMGTRENQLKEELIILKISLETAENNFKDASNQVCNLNEELSNKVG